MARRKPPRQRIMIVDRSERIRNDIKTFLQESDRYEPVGEAATLDDAVRIARASGPDIVLVDVEMAERDGLGVLRDLRMCLPSTTLIVATHTDWEEYDEAARAGGAVASIAKTRLFESLVSTLEGAKQSRKRSLGNGDGGRRPDWAGALGGSVGGGRTSRKVGGLWWRPRGWREWLSGAVSFGWALVRGAPMDSAPPRSYWSYIRIAIVAVISLLFLGMLGGEFGRIDDLSKGLILIGVLALAGAQFRQIRRPSSATRALKVNGRLHNTRREAQANAKGGENE